MKQTTRCGNVGKLTRIAAAISGEDFESLYPRKDPLAPFLVLGGYSDFILPSAFSNSHGAITGLANIAPVCADCPAVADDSHIPLAFDQPVVQAIRRSET